MKYTLKLKNNQTQQTETYKIISQKPKQTLLKELQQYYKNKTIITLTPEK